MPTGMSFRVQENLDALRDPAVWPVGAAVELIQTHISVVALCGDRAFKIKKAVRLSFVDFSTATLREQACRDELRLNRRLCPDVYLGVVPLRSTPSGFRVGEAEPSGGVVVDQVVVMRRLPRSRMLDVLLERDAVSPLEINALATQVAAFHARQVASADEHVRALGAPARLLGFIEDNFTETAALQGDVFPERLHQSLHDAVKRAAPSLRARLERRATEGRIIDGHGDLHARNVCMVDPPVIYDCLEFRSDFRCGDVALEVAFLAMDLRYRGHRELADAFVSAYVEAAGDGDLPAVLPELIRYRAMVRAKVDALAACDATLDSAARARAAMAARRHLRLCAWTSAEECGDSAVVACGLPASGKSFVFDLVARETGWPIVATDRVRKELAGVSEGERLPPSAYSIGFSARVYAEVLRRAATMRGPVLVDGNFPTARLRTQAVVDLARPTVFLHFDVTPDLAHARLRARESAGGSVSDADSEVYERLRRRFEAPAAGDDVCRLDGAAAPDALADEIAGFVIGRVRAGGGSSADA